MVRAINSASYGLLQGINVQAPECAAEMAPPYRPEVTWGASKSLARAGSLSILIRSLSFIAPHKWNKSKAAVGTHVVRTYVGRIRGIARDSWVTMKSTVCHMAKGRRKDEEPTGGQRRFSDGRWTGRTRTDGCVGGNTGNMRKCRNTCTLVSGSK